MTNSSQQKDASMPKQIN